MKMTGNTTESDMQKTNSPTVPVLTAPRIDPAHNIISSERYLESLEKKLNRIKGKSQKEVTSHEMIKSLEKAKDDHMQNFMAATTLTECSGEDIEQYKGSVVNKTHTNNSHSLEEVVALVYQDELSKVNSEHSTEDTTPNKT